jgi:hypothetical protein
VVVGIFVDVVKGFSIVFVFVVVVEDVEALELAWSTDCQGTGGCGGRFVGCSTTRIVVVAVVICAAVDVGALAFGVVSDQRSW